MLFSLEESVGGVRRESIVSSKGEIEHVVFERQEL